MPHDLTETERLALLDAVRESYLEIFPTATIESKLDVLAPASYIAVTCSPTKGVDETLDMSERLADRGFRVVPHIAARMVRDRQHLREIISRINKTPIVSVFVPGGDADQPLGQYGKALDLLRDLADIEHRFIEIGIGAHPEGHPVASDEELLEQLLAKQEYANYLVTQMCFDAARIERWLRDVRAAGVRLDAWLGIPGAADRAAIVEDVAAVVREPRKEALGESAHRRAGGVAVVAAYLLVALLARHTRSLRVCETASPPTFYLPPEDVHPELLVPVEYRLTGG